MRRWSVFVLCFVLTGWVADDWRSHEKLHDLETRVASLEGAVIQLAHASEDNSDASKQNSASIEDLSQAIIKLSRR